MVSESTCLIVHISSIKILMNFADDEADALALDLVFNGLASDVYDLWCTLALV